MRLAYFHLPFLSKFQNLSRLEWTASKSISKLHQCGKSRAMTCADKLNILLLQIFDGQFGQFISTLQMKSSEDSINIVLSGDLFGVFDCIADACVSASRNYH